MQNEVRQRYQAARQAWSSKAIQAAAALLGVTERAYCDAYISRNYGPVTWTGSSAVEPAPLDMERAYREARCQG